MIYFSELENLPTYDAKGAYLGHLVDLCINATSNPLLVAFYLIKNPAGEMFCISHACVPAITVRAAQTNVLRDELFPSDPDEGLIRIKKDVLDQQIIDVNDQKVVRVIDVDFDIQPNTGHTDLRIMSVSVGWAAAVRRLLQGAFAKHKVRKLADLFPPKTIPWEFVNLIEPDPARRVKLRISYSKLAELHPADLADILEDLSRDEQRSVIESLDDETAAEAVSEIPTRMQVALLDSLPTDKAADIVEEMDPDEAADVLQELDPQTSAEVLAKMEREEADEVRELLGFEENTAGGMMTTEFVALDNAGDAGSVIGALRRFDGSVDSVYAIYLVDDKGVLTGVVPPAHLLLAEKNALLKDLCTDQVISVPSYGDEKTVVNLFRKYNLLVLPVVDDAGRILGVITGDDVFELLVKDE